MAEPGAKFVFYEYQPSLPAAVVFIILFGASAALHIWQLTKSRTWYFIPFVLGCLFEAIGYIGRAMSSSEFPDFTKNPYIIQSILLLLGPTLFAASIYMVLGRVVLLLGGDSYSLIRPKWLTKVFVTGDVLSFFAQSGGGAMLATAKDKGAVRQGEQIILGGLGIQILFFGFFMVVTLVFHIRMTNRPTSKSYTVTTPWKALLVVLYISSLLIMVRSVYRVAEYAMGSDGALKAHEYWLYIFDSAPMICVSVLFNWFHPSRVVNEHAIAGVSAVGGRSVTSLDVLEGGRHRERRPSQGQAQGQVWDGGHNHMQGSGYK